MVLAQSQGRTSNRPAPASWTGAAGEQARDRHRRPRRPAGHRHNPGEHARRQLDRAADRYRPPDRRQAGALPKPPRPRHGRPGLRRRGATGGVVPPGDRPGVGQAADAPRQWPGGPTPGGPWMAFRKNPVAKPRSNPARESETEPGDRLVLEVHVDVELVDLTAVEGLDRAGAREEATLAGDRLVLLKLGETQCDRRRQHEKGWS
jgi:hypothetical protein